MECGNFVRFVDHPDWPIATIIKIDLNKAVIGWESNPHIDVSTYHPKYCKNSKLICRAIVTLAALRLVE